MTRPVRLKVIDDEFFTRSKSGAIWGSVHFEIGDDSSRPRLDGPNRGFRDSVVGSANANYGRVSDQTASLVHGWALRHRHID